MARRQDPSGHESRPPRALSQSIRRAWIERCRPTSVDLVADFAGMLSLRPALRCGCIRGRRRSPLLGSGRGNAQPRGLRQDQLRGLASANGCDKSRLDRGPGFSAKMMNRPRFYSHLLRALEEFSHLRIDFVSHSESIDTSTPMGKMIFTVL